MLALITLILCFSCLNIFAGGLIPEALYLSCFFVNLVATIEIYRNYKRKHLCEYKLPLFMGVFILSLIPFFLPQIGLYTSPEKLELFQQVKFLKNQGQQLQLWELNAESFTNGLSYWSSVKIALIFLTIPATVYLTAILNKRNKLRLTYVMLFVATINILANIIDKHIFNYGDRIWGIFQTQAQKSSGAFVNENHYGVFLCFFLPLILTQIFTQFNKKNYIVLSTYATLLPLFIYGILLSVSRGAFLICALSVALTFLLQSNNSSKYGGAMKCAILTSCILLFAYFTPSKLNNEIKNDGLEMGLGRELIHSKTPEIFSDFKMGIGPGAYEPVAAQYFIGSSSHNTLANHSESIYYTFLLELGFFPCLILIVTFICFITKVIKNIQACTLSTRLQNSSIIALVAFLCHATYDYPFEIPTYAFTIAIFSGFLLTPGEHYLKGLHKSIQLKLSALIMILPLISLTLCAYFWSTTSNKYTQNGSFEYNSQSSLKVLVQNLEKNPASWHLWYYISQKILETNKQNVKPLAEHALKQAVTHHPNQDLLWKKLSILRLQTFEFDKAALAYRRYFLLQAINTRKKLKDQALVFMSLDEYNYLLHLEMPMQERTREYIRSI